MGSTSAHHPEPTLGESAKRQRFIGKPEIILNDPSQLAQ
jgi:hypothetical protein